MFVLAQRPRTGAQAVQGFHEPGAGAALVDDPADLRRFTCASSSRDGLHMYGRPLSDNYIASEVTIPDIPACAWGTAQYPPTHPREFPALGVTLNV